MNTVLAIVQIRVAQKMAILKIVEGKSSAFGCNNQKNTPGVTDDTQCYTVHYIIQCHFSILSHASLHFPLS